VVSCSTIFAQEQEVPPPPPKHGDSKEQYQKAQQLYEQYRLTRHISEETANEILEFYGKIEPESVKEIKKIKTENPKIYQDRLRHMEKEMRYMSRLQEEDPKRFEQALVLRKLEGVCNKLARQFRESTDDSEKSDIEKELRDKLVDLFEMKEQEKELEIERIMDRVDKMRQEIEERKANKDKIIELRLNELTGKEHLSRW
jgi:hypothetical protein